MAQISSKLRSVEGGGLTYWCQGCKTRHMIRHGDGPGERWGWNGDVEKPTFSPSVLTTNGHYLDTHVTGARCWCVYNVEHPEQEHPFTCQRCHTFIRNGMVEFLSDCSHELAGQTLPLPDLPGHMQD